MKAEGQELHSYTATQRRQCDYDGRVGTARYRAAATPPARRAAQQQVTTSLTPITIQISAYPSSAYFSQVARPRFGDGGSQSRGWHLFSHQPPSSTTGTMSSPTDKDSKFSRKTRCISVSVFLLLGGLAGFLARWLTRPLVIPLTQAQIDGQSPLALV